MSKILATTMVAGALALTALCSPATAAASSRDSGVSNGNVQTAVTEDVSAQRRQTRRHTRRYRVAPVYRAPNYYGYYGPTYYDRPYRQPPRPFFGLGGWW